MSSDNVVVVISNNSEITEFVNSKLVLLRDVDKVEHTNTIDAMECVREKIPNIIILHTESNDSKRIKLVSEIKQDNKLKQIPIILISQKCSPEYLVEMFDAGISDMLSTPVKEHELLFRVMWNIQKSEEHTHNELQNRFLSNLGITQTETGFYNEKYSEEFLTNQVEYAIEYKQQACVMYIEVQNIDDIDKDPKDFSKIIKKSIRLNDWAGIAGKNKYYVFFPKTKLNGCFAVFERLKKNSGFDYKISASVIEVIDKPFGKLEEFLQKSIQNIDEGGSSLIVASETILKQKRAEKPVVINDEEIDKAFKAIIRNNKENLNINLEKAKGKSVMDSIAKDYEDDVDKRDDVDVRNAIVSKQVYKNKCSIVLEPVFKKYKSKIDNAEKYIFVEYDVNLQESYFKISKGANELVLSLKYYGLSTVTIETSQIFNNRINSSDRVEVEVIKIDTKFLTFILEELIESLKSC